MNTMDPSRAAVAAGTPTADGQTTNADSGHEWARLLSFYIQGSATEPTAGTSVAEQLTPALLYPYRDHSRIRYVFPICLVEDEPERFALPLTTLIDGLIEQVCAAGEKGERLRRDILKLEVLIRRFADAGIGRLSEFWDRAAQQLGPELGLEGAAQEQLRQNLASARSALTVDGLLVNCDDKTPVQLAQAALAFYWSQHIHEHASDLVELLHRLENRLQSEFARSPRALSPEHLKASVATGRDDELDFDVLSSLLASRDRGPEMPAPRQERLRRALNALSELQPLFDPAAEFPGESEALLDTATESCDEALALHTGLMQKMVSFFASARIARLELDEAYQESIHNNFFERFSAEDLEESERRLCPPTLLVVNSKSISAVDQRKLFDILDSGMPIKVVLLVPDVCSADAGDKLPGCGWVAQLARMAMSFNRAYVLQSTNSNVDHLLSGLVEGMRYPGPALFSIYTGDLTSHPGLSSYLVAASSLESRAFASFVYNPANGPTWADRFSLAGNPQLEEDWPEDEYQDQAFKFTIADFLAGDRRYAQHFRRISDELSSEDLLPLTQFIELNSSGGFGKLPYIVMADDKGVPVRVVPSRSVVRAVRRGLMNWRSLQELGGINNSHVARQIEAEKQRLLAEKQAEIEQLQQKYDAELDKNLADLSGEIVRRIAAGLLDQAQAPSGPLTSAAPPAAAPVVEKVEAPAAPAAPVEEEEEDDFAVSDDPYIDTPLCTTCNECTNLNGLMFAYDGNKQAYIKDANAGTFLDLVRAAELCPVAIIHPGKPKNPDEPGVDDLVKRAAKFN